METKLWAILLVIFCGLLGGIGQILLKVGSNAMTSSPLSWILNLPLMGGMAIYGIAFVLFMIALKHGQISVLYPLIATSYVWVAIFANRFLDEPFEWTQWIGIGLILMGAYFVVANKTVH
jgi:drug/metabolite transporter (DMT)-like permease